MGVAATMMDKAAAGGYRWPEVKVIRLRQLVEDPHRYTVREIAEIMGISKSSVTGKLQQQKITLGPRPNSRGGGKSMPTLARRQPAGTVSLHTCQYIAGDPRQVLLRDADPKCGQPTIGDSPYCEQHTRLCYVKPQAISPSAFRNYR